MDLFLLRSFVTVVDTGNFTRAGERLHLTQSTVSQQVLRLEQSLGRRLFPVGALYRQEMIRAVEGQGRRWRVSYSSSSLNSLCAAVRAGLGVSLLPAGSVQSGHRADERSSRARCPWERQRDEAASCSWMFGVGTTPRARQRVINPEGASIQARQRGRRPGLIPPRSIRVFSLSSVLADVRHGGAIDVEWLWYRCCRIPD